MQEGLKSLEVDEDWPWEELEFEFSNFEVVLSHLHVKDRIARAAEGSDLDSGLIRRLEKPGKDSRAIEYSRDIPLHRGPPDIVFRAVESGNLWRARANPDKRINGVDWADQGQRVSGLFRSQIRMKVPLGAPRLVFKGNNVVNKHGKAALSIEDNRTRPGHRAREAWKQGQA